MGEQRRKFTNDEILMCFEEAQRRPRGKIELNTTEIQTILNEDVLPGDVAVSRPSVKNRMPELVKDNKLERSKHGQSWHYRLPTDMERLFGPRGDIPKPPASETGGGPSLVERVAGYLGATALVGTVAAVAAGALADDGRGLAETGADRRDVGDVAVFEDGLAAVLREHAVVVDDMHRDLAFHLRRQLDVRRALAEDV